MDQSEADVENGLLSNTPAPDNHNNNGDGLVAAASGNQSLDATNCHEPSERQGLLAPTPDKPSEVKSYDAIASASAASGAIDSIDDISTDALSSTVKPTAESASADTITPVATGGKKKDKQKSGRKQVADELKTDMAAERTFFKYLWTGLHTGAIGTFLLVSFPGKSSDGTTDPYRVIAVAFAWFVAMALVLFGLLEYNRRQRALRTGSTESMPRVIRECGPYLVVGGLALVISVGLIYAVHALFVDGVTPKTHHHGNPLGLGGV